MEDQIPYLTIGEGKYKKELSKLEVYKLLAKNIIETSKTEKELEIRLQDLKDKFGV